MSKRAPTHPGLTVRHDCLEPLALNITDAAKALGVSRLTVSNIVNCKTGISPDMAIRFEKMGWSSADMWLRMQQAHDLAIARRHEADIKVHRIRATSSRAQQASA